MARTHTLLACLCLLSAAEAQGQAVNRLDEAVLVRAERMLAIQMDVKEKTARLDRDIGRARGRIELAHAARANHLADREGEVGKEAGAVLKMLQEAGVAEALGEVFEQVRADAGNVRARLGQVDVGAATQSIEADLAETLAEMIEALKRRPAAGAPGRQ